MKKTLLLLSLATVGLSAFAQKKASSITESPLGPIAIASTSNPLAKTTNTSDTILGAIHFSSTFVHFYEYAHDTGFITGMNAYGDKGFAQRYDFNGADSSVKVLGGITFFLGTTKATTTKTVTMKCWSVGAKSAITGLTNWHYSGLPNAVVAQSSSVSLNTVNSQNETTMWFTTPAPASAIGASFFIGPEFSAYTPTALAGDTLGVGSDSLSTLTRISYTSTDTVLNDYSAIESSGGIWDDLYANTGVAVDLFIIPILYVTHYNTGFQGVTRNNLTWYGNYPNPANGNTNFKFALNTSANVTIEINDMSGRKVDVINQSNVVAGTHEIPYNTSKLAAGNYTYIIRTNNGDAMASILSVVK